MDRKNIFVAALTDLQRRELETVSGAERYAFHSLLDLETLVEPEEYVFSDLLDQARRQLREFDGSVDAVIAHWDFPSSVLAPILACEHKYWSRLEQAAVVPDVVPQFCAFDPFADDPLSTIDLPYPFWIKPVKSFSSQLGFRIEGPDDFDDALEDLREGVGRLGNAFDEVLDMVDLPDAIAETEGTTCLAEQIISGVQAAPEGYLYQGEFAAHGVFDMLKGDGGSSFDRLDYPSGLPASVQQRMIEVSERLLRHIGFDNGCFNVEFMWDRDADQLWLIEVNTRMSQSHSDMFIKVDGASNHEIAIDIALGQRPTFPHREGPYAVAAQCHIPHDEDAVVTAVPSEQDIAALDERYPGTIVELAVEPGDRLSELPNQGTYRYELGAIYLGADSREDLERRYEDCLEALPFTFAPVDGD